MKRTITQAEYKELEAKLEQADKLLNEVDARYAEMATTLGLDHDEREAHGWLNDVVYNQEELDHALEMLGITVVWESP